MRGAVLGIVTCVALAACGSTAERPTASPVVDHPMRGDEVTAEDLQSSAAVSMTDVDSGGTGGKAPSDAGDVLAAPAPDGGAPEPIRLGVQTFARGGVSLLGQRFEIQDTKPMIRAVVESINEAGGLGGRPIDLVIVERRPEDQLTSESNIAALEEADCVSFAEDHAVFLVVSLLASSALAFDCYASHETPIFSYALMDDEGLTRTWPWVLPPPTHSLTSAATHLPSLLHRAGLLRGRVGVLVWDQPEWRRTADDIVIPGLRAAGAEVVDVFYAPEESLEQSQSEFAAAVLRFRAHDVEEVVIWDFGIHVWPMFAQNAESQRFRPRYGLHSFLYPAPGLSLAPAAQRSGAVAAGWVPGADVRDEEYPLAEPERRCFDLVNERTGSSYSRRADPNDLTSLAGAALNLCESFAILQAALAPTAGDALRQDHVAYLLQALGETTPWVTPPPARYSNRKLHGGAFMTTSRFVAECDCFRYERDFLRVDGG